MADLDPLRVTRLILQLVFTLGLLLVLVSIADFKTGKMETRILMGIMLAIIA